MTKEYVPNSGITGSLNGWRRRLKYEKMDMSLCLEDFGVVQIEKIEDMIRSKDERETSEKKLKNLMKNKSHIKER